MLSPIIKTQNYILRSFKQEDALLWQKWDIDSEIQLHTPEPLNEPQDIQEQYEYIKECEQDEVGYYWSIETNGGIAIGTISLTEINNHHKIAEIGIVIGDKNYWGRGVATEVISDLVNYSFSNLNIEYISANVEEGNVPMQKVFEKVGFKKDGLFVGARVKGKNRINVVHFSISPSNTQL